MHRLRPLACTSSTIRAHLFGPEDILAQQPGVGLYDGKDKDDRYPDGILYLTSLRLLYIDSSQPHSHSCYLDLSIVRQTEFWGGFLKSSPKITLLLGDPLPKSPSSAQHAFTSPHLPPHNNSDINQTLNHPAASPWACPVCAFSNPPGPKCGLCGVPWQSALTVPCVPSAPHARSPSAEPPRNSALKGFNRVRASSEAFTTQPSCTLQQQPFLSATTSEIPCPTCTYLNHPSMSRCEMCDSLLGTLSLNSSVNQAQLGQTEPIETSTLQHSRASTPAPPASFPFNSYIRLSFRKGGDKHFYLTLKKALQAKAWQKLLRESRSVSIMSPSAVRQSHSGECDTNTRKAIGIDGILKRMDSNHQLNRTELAEGLQDLQALMSKAKEMVQTARAINAKLSALENPTVQANDSKPTEQNATIIRSSLVKLGLTAPAVTADMIASDQAYAQELARELGGFITRLSAQNNSGLGQGLCRSTGIVSLDEVWCLWNRARGVVPVSPVDMLAACQFLHHHTDPPLELYTFRSGLKVIHTAHYSAAEFSARTTGRLCAPHSANDATLGFTGMTTLEIAQAEGVTVSIALELLEMIEQSEMKSLVRDLDPRTGIVKWFPDLISSYVINHGPSP